MFTKLEKKKEREKKIDKSRGRRKNSRMLTDEEKAKKQEKAERCFDNVIAEMNR